MKYSNSRNNFEPIKNSKHASFASSYNNVKDFNNTSKIMGNLKNKVMKVPMKMDSKY